MNKNLSPVEDYDDRWWLAIDVKINISPASLVSIIFLPTICHQFSKNCVPLASSLWRCSWYWYRLEWQYSAVEGKSSPTYLSPWQYSMRATTRWFRRWCMSKDEVTHFNDDVSPGGRHAGVPEGSTGVQLAAHIVMLFAGLRLACLCLRSVGVVSWLSGPINCCIARLPIIINLVVLWGDRHLWSPLDTLDGERIIISFKRKLLVSGGLIEATSDVGKYDD